MNKDKKPKELKGRRESKSTNSSKKKGKLKDRLELKPKELNMKNEWKWKDLSEKRSLKNIDSIKRE